MYTINEEILIKNNRYILEEKDIKKWKYISNTIRYRWSSRKKGNNPSDKENCINLFNFPDTSENVDKPWMFSNAECPPNGTKVKIFAIVGEEEQNMEEYMNC